MARSGEEFNNENMGFPSEDRTIHNVGTITAGTISVLQSTTPWLVSQYTSPWAVSGTVMIQGQTYDGSIPKVFTSDFDSNQILSDILKEMKKMNLQLAILTDTIVKDTEVQ